MEVYDPTIELTEWKRPAAQAVNVRQAYGGLIVDWPSGKRTLEFYGATVVRSDLEMATAHGNVLSRETENLVNTMADFRERAVRNGYLIRTKHRRKARRIVAHEWVRLSAVKSSHDFFDWRASR